MSHVNSMEWMQQAQQDSMQLREMLSLAKQEQLAMAVQMADQTKVNKLQVDEQLDAVAVQLRDLDGKNTAANADLRGQAQQRIDDLDLIEKAMSTIQSQQIRLRGSVETSVQVGPCLVPCLVCVCNNIMVTVFVIHAFLSEGCKNRPRTFTREAREAGRCCSGKQSRICRFQQNIR